MQQPPQPSPQPLQQLAVTVRQPPQPSQQASLQQSTATPPQPSLQQSAATVQQPPQPLPQPLQQSTVTAPQPSQPLQQSLQQSTVTPPQPPQPSQSSLEPPRRASRFKSNSNVRGKRQKAVEKEHDDSIVEKRNRTEEAKCEAFLCQEPKSQGRRRLQDWILCETCKKWLHYECAGVVSPPRGTYDCGCRRERLER